MNSETVLVTGATGMLGRMVLDKLIPAGFKIIVLIEPSQWHSIELPKEISLLKGDIRRPETYRDTLKTCTYVIHIAASTQVYPRRNANCYNINTEAVKLLAEEVLQSSVKRLVHIGTASSFGSGTKTTLRSELSDFNLAAYGMDYINSKQQAQSYLLQLHSQRQLPVIIINPTFMIGPYDRIPSSGRMLKTLLSGSLPGYAYGGRSFVYSGDVAEAIVNALTQGRNGQCYITGGENLSYKDFFTLACTLYNKPFTLKRIPLGLTHILGFLSSAWARVVQKPPLLSYGVSLLAGKYQFYSSAKATAELNYKITPLSNAIKESVDWMVKHNVFKIQ